MAIRTIKVGLSANEKAVMQNDIYSDILENTFGLNIQGTGTSTNILAMTENKGVYIGTDTNHWYYFLEGKYVDGGVLQLNAHIVDLGNEFTATTFEEFLAEVWQKIYDHTDKDKRTMFVCYYDSYYTCICQEDVIYVYNNFTKKLFKAYPIDAYTLEYIEVTIRKPEYINSLSRSDTEDIIEFVKPVHLVLNYERYKQFRRSGKTRMPLDNALGGSVITEEPVESISLTEDLLKLIYPEMPDPISVTKLKKIAFGYKAEFTGIDPSALKAFEKSTAKGRAKETVSNFIGSIGQYFEYYTVPIRLCLKPVTNIRRFYNKGKQSHVTYLTGKHGILINIKFYYIPLTQRLTITYTLEKVELK